MSAVSETVTGPLLLARFFVAFDDILILRSDLRIMSFYSSTFVNNLITTVCWNEIFSISILNLIFYFYGRW